MFDPKSPCGPSWASPEVKWTRPLPTWASPPIGIGRSKIGVLRKLKNKYEHLIHMAESSGNPHKVKTILNQWLEDLTAQNNSLIHTFKSLEKDELGKIDLIEMLSEGKKQTQEGQQDSCTKTEEEIQALHNDIVQKTAAIKLIQCSIGKLEDDVRRCQGLTPQDCLRSLGTTNPVQKKLFACKQLNEEHKKNKSFWKLEIEHTKKKIDDCLAAVSQMRVNMEKEKFATEEASGAGHDKSGLLMTKINNQLETVVNKIKKAKEEKVELESYLVEEGYPSTKYLHHQMKTMVEAWSQATHRMSLLESFMNYVNYCTEILERVATSHDLMVKNLSKNCPEMFLVTRSYDPNKIVVCDEVKKLNKQQLIRIIEDKNKTIAALMPNAKMVPDLYNELYGRRTILLGVLARGVWTYSQFLEKNNELFKHLSVFDTDIIAVSSNPDDWDDTGTDIVDEEGNCTPQSPNESNS